jgi:hypothetical protein
MLWLALLGEEIALLHHLPQMDNNLHACPEELAEAPFLHLGRPDDAGHPVLDVPGGTKNTSSRLVVLTSLTLSSLESSLLLLETTRLPLFSSSEAPSLSESTLLVAATEVAEEAAAEVAEIAIFGCVVCVVCCVWLVYRCGVRVVCCSYLP